ncbi:MAG: hypothetical protein AAF609_22455 [Cyanobacteria bacterium P01_C01_bin.120]
MNHQSPDSRRQAAHKFVDALDELEAVFKSEAADETAPRQTDCQAADASQEADLRPPAPPHSELVDIGSQLDDAVQDIEQFMSTENHPHPEL